MQKLQDIFIKQGEFLDPGPGERFSLDTHNCFWYIEKGAVDCFLQNKVSDIRNYNLVHVLRAEQNNIIFNMNNVKGSDTELFSRNCSGTRVYKVDFSVIEALDPQEQYQFAILVKKWIYKLAKIIQISNVPFGYIDLTTNKPKEVKSEASLSTIRGVKWLSIDQGEGYFNGDRGLVVHESHAYFPVTGISWLEFDEPVKVHYASTLELLQKKQLLGSLDYYHHTILHLFLINAENADLFDNVLLFDRVDVNQNYVKNAIEHLRVSFSDEQPHFLSTVVERDNLLFALKKIGEKLKIEFTPIDKIFSSKPFMLRFSRLCTKARATYREVALEGDWYKQDNGHLLGLDTANNPIALIQTTPFTYHAYNPITDESKLVTAEFVKTLSDKAYAIYPTFSKDKLGILDLLTFSLRAKVGDDLTIVFVITALATVLSFLPPLLNKYLFDQVIPFAEIPSLVQIILALFAASLGRAFFELTRSFAMLRLETKLATIVQSAVWIRVMKLSPSFFKDYTGGDLVSRIGAVDAIRQFVSDKTLSTVLSSVFSISGFALLFYYESTLAVIALFYIFGMAFLSVIFSAVKLRYERVIANAGGKISGILGELINGIVKIRVSGAETRAFGYWGKEFAELRRTVFKSRRVTIFLDSINEIASTFGTILIYLSIIAFTDPETFTTGTYMAFNAAYGQVSGAIFGLIGIITSTLDIIPTYERAKPILKAEPETIAGGEDPGELHGQIEISNLSFRYKEDGPLILSNINMYIKQGEFIAIVGPSGCGKSTLMRMLLLFEKPEKGSIYFDGKDTKNLDLELLRHNFGAVIQDSQLIPGNIYENIAGTSGISVDDAWEAAKLASLDKEIKELPMGMNTMVGISGGGLSGGQKQRLIIARALATKPKIIMFDEATSALDNANQKVISDHLAQLKMTRIVIAHRLSTVIHADKIYVMEDGKIIESGTYEDLMLDQKLFSKLAQAQIA